MNQPTMLDDEVFSGFLFAAANVAYITAMIILHVMLDDVTWTKNVGLCWTNMVDPTNGGFNTFRPG